MSCQRCSHSLWDGGSDRAASCATPSLTIIRRGGRSAPSGSNMGFAVAAGAHRMAAGVIAATASSTRRSPATTASPSSERPGVRDGGERRTNLRNGRSASCCVGAFDPRAGKRSTDGVDRAWSEEDHAPHGQEPFGLSNLPSDVALILSQQEYTHLLADDLDKVMRLSPEDRDLLGDEILGAVAALVDRHLP
jgi:hypothetical protein